MLGYLTLVPPSFQSREVNANVMQIVLTTGLVLITSVLTPAVATPVGQMQSAPLPTIVQFALARLVGLEMPMKSASNVSKKINPGSTFS